MLDQITYKTYFAKMRHHLTMFFYFSLLLFCVFAGRPAHAQCSPGADPSLMDKVYGNYLKNLSGKPGQTIAVLPFIDLHGYQPEPLLPYGIPYLIYDMYSDTNPQILNPLVTFALARSLNLSDANLTDVTHIKDVADKLGAHFVVFGSVQRSSLTEVRVIIHVYDAKTKTIISPAVEFSTELNDSFFSLMRASLKDAFARANSKLNLSDYTDPTLDSFRYYVRGLQLSESYNATTLDVAIPWFEKSLKDNYEKYDDAALALARVHFMSAMLQKLNKSDFTQHLLQAKKALELVRGKTTAPKYKLVTRFVKGHTKFLSALTAFQNHNTANALQSAKEALALLPEDGLAEEIFWSVGGGAKGKATRNAPVCL